MSGQKRTKRTLDLDAAAQVLGTSKEALRKRIKRGSIEATKDQAGRWQVEVEEPGPDTRPDNVQDAGGLVVQALKEHIETLKRENARQQRTIEALQRDKEQVNYILALKEQKILELEAPKENRGPWLQRIFKRAD
jgi:predicted RNase H-like nuclease (RuvC/YqgF family)